MRPQDQYLPNLKKTNGPVNAVVAKRQSNKCRPSRPCTALRINQKAIGMNASSDSNLAINASPNRRPATAMDDRRSGLFASTPEAATHNSAAGVSPSRLYQCSKCRPAVKL